MRIAVPAHLTSEAARPRGTDLMLLSGPTMGVDWTVRLLAPAGLDRRRAQAAVQGTLDRVVGQMSHWEPGSDLGRFNRAGAGTTHALPLEMAEVVGRALHWAQASDGAFDPTLGTLADLWGFGPPGPVAQPPSDEAVAGSLAKAGWRKLRLEDGRLGQPGGLALDLSGIAKGYGLDAAALALGRLGVADHLIEIGGELRGSGVKADGSPWWVDVEAPPGTQVEPLRIALHGLAAATSGDYRRFAELGGTRVAHTLDPRTGRPLGNGVASVTALAATGMDADALASVLMVLGPEAGLAFATAHGVAAHMLFRRDGVMAELVTPALAAMLD